MSPLKSVQTSRDQATGANDQLLAADDRRERVRVGDALPQRMTTEDMQHAFDISSATFYRWLHAGLFDRFELDRIGARAWSGEAVQRYFATVGRDEVKRGMFGHKSAAFLRKR